MNIATKKVLRHCGVIFNSIIVLGMSPMFVRAGMPTFNRLDEILNTIFILLIFYILFKIILHHKYYMYYYKKNFSLFIIWLIIFVISLITTNNIISSMRQCVLLLFTLIYAIYLCSKYKIKELVRIIFNSQVLTTLITIIYSYIYPSLAYEYYKNELVLRGTFETKNNLAAQVAFGILISIIYLIINKKMYKNKLLIISVIFIQFMVLLQTKSTTSLLTIIIALITALIYKIKRKKFNIVVLFSSINIGIVVVLCSIYKNINIFSDKMGIDLTLTGRIHIWKSIIDEVLNLRLLLGHGYSTFWGQNLLIEYRIYNKYTSIIGGNIHGSHNGILELILQVGIIGTFLIISILAWIGYKNKKSICNIENIIFVIYVSYLFIYIITERSFWSIHYQTLMLFISCILVNLKFNKKVDNKE